MPEDVTHPSSEKKWTATNARPLSGMHRILVTLLLATSVVHADSYPGKKSNFHGFERYDFQFAGRKAIIVAPKQAAADKPWVWRARFFGHQPQADVEMLKHGWHIAYADVGGLFGAPSAVEHWNKFHQHVTSKWGFHQRPVLEGMSRGGLIIFNWAKLNPDKVTAIYGDAPVCDFKSWPGGKGDGKGSPKTWQQCLKIYGFNETEALDAKVNPIDGLESLAKAKIPVLNVVGDADVVVPVKENSDILEHRYRKLGGPIKVIHKPGIGHHPHSLKDPAPIVNFFLHAFSPSVN